MQRRVNGGPRHHPGRGVHAGRHVDGHDRAPERVQRLDQAGLWRPRRTAKAGAEDRVDDDVGVAELALRIAAGVEDPHLAVLGEGGRRDSAVPPFEPPPQTASTRRASGYLRATSPATAAPARCISSGIVSG